VNADDRCRGALVRAFTIFSFDETWRAYAAHDVAEVEPHHSARERLAKGAAQQHHTFSQRLQRK
jgi:hypothetical protein